MIGQYHSGGMLRKYAEDALVAYLTNSGVASVRHAYADTEQDASAVVVWARQTREMDNVSYRLARYMDIEARVLTYAEPEDAADAVRDEHFGTVQRVGEALMQSDIAAQINNSQLQIAFSSLYVTGDAGGIQDGKYMTTITIEALVSPK